MRRHARSDNKKIAGDPEAEEEIGSRVFPFRTTPTSMPSVGTRRSTRVFVPKAVNKPVDTDSARVLRSGKRLSPSKPVGKRPAGDRDHLTRLFGNAGDAADLRRWKDNEDEGDVAAANVFREQVLPESEVEAPEELLESIDKKRFGIVYGRKRPRLRSDVSVSSSSRSGDGGLKERRYGIGFVRKRLRKDSRSRTLRGARIAVTELGITESARNFAEKLGISDEDLGVVLDDPVVLLVFVETSCGSSSYHFGAFLSSILRWMRRTSVTFSEFVIFLLSKSIAWAFSLHGIHFLPVQGRQNNVVDRNALLSCGCCTIFGARQLVPLVSLDFSALPFYFKSLHLSMVLGSQYLPGVLARYVMELHTNLSGVIGFKEHVSHVPAETGFSRKEITASGNLAVKRNSTNCVVKIPESVAQTAVVLHGPRSDRHQRRRSPLSFSRDRNHFFPYSHTAAKARSLRDCIVEPVREKPLEACIGDFFSIRDESPASNQNHMKSPRKSPVEPIKELKLALAEVKQNIDSVRCCANILVSDSDRCWREEGAEVSLESSGSKECYISVKTGGMTRYLHRPQEMTPSVFNRHTHANIWTAGDGWKLEFCEKWDWVKFKELHRECRERNAQDISVKTIPVPGVQEVSGYEENTKASFVLPEMYINMADDEVRRALASKNANYDMDSGDEVWIKQLNSSSLDRENSVVNHISEESFEKIIFALEKDAYIHPDDIPNKDRALDICQDLGNRDIVAAAYDYWLRKRKGKRKALVEVFQGPPVRTGQFIPKPFLRKKRSFKRQRSQAGRGKPEYFFQAMAEQELLRKFKEAESAADIAMESAIRLRSRAQMFMMNAELVAYRSVMALNMAESIQASGSSDYASSIFE